MTGYDSPSVLYGIGRQMLGGGAAVVIGWTVRCLKYVGIYATERLNRHVSHTFRSCFVGKVNYSGLISLNCLGVSRDLDL